MPPSLKPLLVSGQSLLIAGLVFGVKNDANKTPKNRLAIYSGSFNLGLHTFDDATKLVGAK